MYQYKQDPNPRLDRFLLRSLKSARIVPLKQVGVHGKRGPPQGVQGRFSLSAQLHSFMSSFKNESLNAVTNKLNSAREENTEENRVRRLVPEIELAIDASGSKSNLLNWPLDLVERFVHDLVALEGIERFGFHKYGNEMAEYLLSAVKLFVLRVANDIRGGFVHVHRGRQPARGEKRRSKIVNRGSGSESGDDTKDVAIDEIESENDESEEDGGSEMIVMSSGDEEESDDSAGNKKKDDDLFDEEDVKSDDLHIEEPVQECIQIHEVFASLWPYEELISHFVKVLSIVKDTPIWMEQLIQEWHQYDSLKECLAGTMRRLLEIEIGILRNNAGSEDDLRSRLNYLASVAKSFDELMAWLTRNQVMSLDHLQSQWNTIRMCTLAATACGFVVEPTFVETISMQFGDGQFDNVSHFQSLLKLVDSSRGSSEASLQWLAQNYIRYFAFSNIQNAIKQDFLEKSIELIGSNHDTAGPFPALKPNAFTRFEMANQLVFHASGKTESSKQIKKALEQKMSASDLNSEIASLLLRARESQIHFDFQKSFVRRDSRFYAPPSTEIAKSARRLNESIDLESFDQIMAIAQCKVYIFYLARFLSDTLESGCTLGLEGLYMKKSTKLLKKKSFFDQIRPLFQVQRTPDRDPSLVIYEKNIKQGLAFYFLSEMWVKIGTISVNVMKSLSFRDLLGFSIEKMAIDHGMVKEQNGQRDERKDNLDRINDDTFLLLKDGPFSDTYDRIMNQLERVFSSRHRDNIAWPCEFTTNQIVLFVAGIFNHFYLKNGKKSMDEVRGFLKKSLAKSMSANECNQSQLERVGSILTKLSTNTSDCEPIRMTRKTNLKDLKLIRFCWHLLGVILSVPKSPFSILFHDPNAFANNYLVGMPEDQSASLMYAMRSHGVWLCPNDHLYFISGSTQPNQSAKCPTCGAGIGNAVGKPMKNAAKGNRKIGIVLSDGNIRPDQRGATEGTAVYDIAMLTPKGYVIMDPVDGNCRELDNVSVQIVRFFVNAIILMHHSEYQGSDAMKFTKLPVKDNESLSKQLFSLLGKYLDKIGKLIGHLSREDTLYLMHDIVNQFYQEFPVDFREGWSDHSIRGRKKFEKWFLNKVIKPVLRDHGARLAGIRARVLSGNLDQFWSRRVDGKLDLGVPASKDFVRQFLPHLNLPFKRVTMHEFVQFVTQERANRIRYPVIWGILETMKLEVGYSVFSLKHFPDMIRWIRFIQSRFNRRLTREEIQTETHKYNARYAIDQCKEQKWGDPTQWENAMNGFVSAWNSIGARNNPSKRGQPRFERSFPADEFKDEKDHEDSADDSIRGAAWEFNRYVRIGDCETLPVDVINGTGTIDKLTQRPTILPKDVAFWHALATPDGLGLMIRHIVFHYVTAHNRILIECHGIEDADDKKEIEEKGLERMDLIHVTRKEDVVAMDEDLFVQMIQESMEQSLRYGVESQGSQLNFNLALLETRLKNEWISGRKLIRNSMEPFKFEFAGEIDILAIFDQIDMRWKKSRSCPYFEPAKKSLLDLLKLKMTQQDGFTSIGGQNEKSSSVKTCKQAVEEVVIALKRYPSDPTSNLIDFMRVNLHLSKQEYEPFEETHLELRHLKDVYKYVQRLYLIPENQWQNIPAETMGMYRVNVPTNEEPLIEKFVAGNDIDQMWDLLIEFKDFLEQKCSVEISGAKTAPLGMYLGYAFSDASYKLLDSFPGNFKLTQAGNVYRLAAMHYSQRFEREQ